MEQNNYFNNFISYVDTNGLISGLNSILKNSGINTQNRFIDLVGGPVDFGIAFISTDKEMILAKNGLIWRNDQSYIDYEKAKQSNSSTTNREIESKPLKNQKISGGSSGK